MLHKLIQVTASLIGAVRRLITIVTETEGDVVLKRVSKSKNVSIKAVASLGKERKSWQR